MANIPIENANGQTVNVATTGVTRDGATEYLELITLADPISANQASVTVPGTSGLYGVAVQGMTSGIPFNTVASVPGSYNSAITSITLGTSTTALLAVNANRWSYILFNLGPAVAYVAYGTTCDAVSNFSFTLSPGEQQYVDNIPWRGAICAIVSSGSAQLQVTELS